MLSLLSLVELSTAGSEAGTIFLSAELTLSGLLHGSPLPSGLMPRLFSTISYAVHGGPKGLSSPFWGGPARGVGHFITGLCSLPALGLCWWCSLYLKTFPCSAACLENGRACCRNQHRVPTLDCSLPGHSQDRINLSVPIAAWTVRKMGQ